MHGQEERRQATLDLSKWAEDRLQTHHLRGHRPITVPPPRKETRRRADQVEKETLRKDPSESSDDELAPNLLDTPSPAEWRSYG
ncbi:hypothetical protein BKA56DRAFT_599771, partial [Ilyonectria sp. MPI-CAGE-AT-0026]